MYLSVAGMKLEDSELLAAKQMDILGLLNLFHVPTPILQN
jgi:hypothetical protein